jgi:hypothetical protein
MLGDVGGTNRMFGHFGEAVDADVLPAHHDAPFSRFPCGVTISQRGDGSGLELEPAITTAMRVPAASQAST